MKTSTCIASCAKYVGREKAIEYVAKAGFDHWDFSMFDMVKRDEVTKLVGFGNNPLGTEEYVKYARLLKRIGEDNGITCNQSHAPFPVSDPFILSCQKRAIECTAEAGGSICVIHPNNRKSAEENAEMYMTLLPFAKEHNVKIATENMWNWDRENDHATSAACSSAEDFLRHILAVNDPYFVACVDIGHCEMKGLETSAEKVIKTLGSHVQALHLHDNDRWHDNHEIPFSMNIDFEKVIKALKEIGYNGVFTLEADQYLKNHGYNEENLLEGMKNLQKSAKTLADMFEKI